MTKALLLLEFGDAENNIIEKEATFKKTGKKKNNFKHSLCGINRN